MFNDNLYTYLNAFGVDITHIDADGVEHSKNANGGNLKGIFDNAYFLVEIGELDLDNTQPRLQCVEADITNVKKADSFRINGELYDVTGRPQPDGTGMAVIPLCLQGKV